MKCPKCVGSPELKSGKAKGYDASVEVCTQCKGVFLDKGELAQFIPNKKKVALLQARGLEDLNQVSAKCPKCDVNMFEGKAPGFKTTLDHCARCNGLWFDRGELHAMIKAATGAQVVVPNSGTAPQGAGTAPPIDPPRAFKDVADSNEEFYWTGTPVFLPFVLSGVPFLICGLIWGAFDLFLFMTGATVKSRGNQLTGTGAKFFLLVHSAPFWLALFNMVRLYLVHGNTHYALTNKRIMIRTGFFGTDFRSIDYDQISDVEVVVGPIDTMFECGSINPFTGRDMMSHTYRNSRSFLQPTHGAFLCIKEPYQVFRLLKELSVNIKTDWQYPNALRPENNPGYNTKYRKAG